MDSKCTHYICEHNHTRLRTSSPYHSRCNYNSIFKKKLCKLFSVLTWSFLMQLNIYTFEYRWKLQSNRNAKMLCSDPNWLRNINGALLPLFKMQIHIFKVSQQVTWPWLVPRFWDFSIIATTSQNVQKRTHPFIKIWSML